MNTKTHRRLLAQTTIFNILITPKNISRYFGYFALASTFLSAELLRLSHYLNNYQASQIILTAHIICGSLLGIFLIKRVIKFITQRNSVQFKKTKPLPFTFYLIIALLILSGLLGTLQLRTNLNIPSWPAPLHGTLSPYAWLSIILLLKKLITTKAIQKSNHQVQ